MPVPISLATICAIGYLVGLFSGQAGRGVVIGLLVFATWVFAYHRGADFDPIYYHRMLVDYFFPLLAASFLGAMIQNMFRFHPIMDGLHLAEEFKEKGRVSYSAIGKLLGKLILVLLVFFGAHISLELHVAGWSFVWAGVVCSVGILAGWLLFWYLFKDICQLFRPAPVELGRRSFWKAEITNYVIVGFIGHEAFVTAYWIWQLVFDNNVTWITSSWFFYAALILIGSLGVLALITSFFLKHGTYDEPNGCKQAENGGAAYTPVPADVEPAATTPSTPGAGSTAGRVSYAATPQQLHLAGFYKNK